MARPGQRYTNFSVTLSTNVRPTHRDEEIALARILEDFEAHIERPQVASRVLGVRFDPNNSLRVPGKTPAEKGSDPRGGRMHIHFSATSLHYDEVRLPDIARALETELEEFAASRGITLAGANAHIKLNKDTYLANYEIKELNKDRIAFNPNKPTAYNRLFGRVAKK